MWPDRRIQDLFGIELPIIQAPMAGPVLSEMVIAVAEAGGLGSLPCAMLTPDQARTQLGIIRQQTSRPINVNFFCHKPPEANPAREAAWRTRLEDYYVELGIDPKAPIPASNRTPFDSELCELVEEFRPEIVSFHFGLPDRSLLNRVKASGAKIISSATTVEEALWLETEGCDAIIAQGYEAGGHRGIFLTDNIASQVGTMALVPQIVDAVKVPVIAAGGIADARGIVAAFALGAAAVQIGTAYLFCPEAKLAGAHRRGAAGSEGQRHRAHQRVHGSSRARDHQPRRPGGRPDVRTCSGISACRRCVGAVAGQVGASWVWRLHGPLVRAGCSPWSRTSGRRTDPAIGRRGAGKVARRLTELIVSNSLSWCHPLTTEWMLPSGSLNHATLMSPATWMSPSLTVPGRS